LLLLIVNKKKNQRTKEGIIPSGLSGLETLEAGKQSSRREI